MVPLKNKQVLVLGLGVDGRAACALLQAQGARVVGMDRTTGTKLREATQSLKRLGAKLFLGARTVPRGSFELAVVSPEIPMDHPDVTKLKGQGVPVIGELELGYQHCYCLNVAVTGTNGKTTTTGLIERILAGNQLKTVVAGNNNAPICTVTDKTRDLDFLVLEVNSFQLEHIKFFRPAVGVMLNVTSDHADRYKDMDDYIRVKARLFANQQAFDWAIIQSEVLAQLKVLKVEIPSKIITFSAYNRRADIYLDRGLIISRVDGWAGPLLNMDHCRLRGPHNAENLMATLAVGRVLRVPLDSMLEPLQTVVPPPHRCEYVAEIAGVQFVNDAKSTNVDSLHKAILSLSPGPQREPNVWLLAGGRSQGVGYHDVGPALSERVKGTFLFGETRETLRAAWSLFTPCTLVDSLLEAVHEAARNAKAGDIVLLSPACSSLDQFESYQHRGETFRHAVKELARTASECRSSGTLG